MEEDLGRAGDITSKALVSPDHFSRAVIRTKDSGIVSGLSLITPVCTAFDHDLCVEICSSDGAFAASGTPLAYIEGSTISILSAERLILNLLQRQSGIATYTRHLTELIGPGRVRLLDTRKTTPGLRFLEKEAVAHGGGVNHRFGLYDMIMAKDTHVKAAGGPDKAVEAARQWREETESNVKIEVEVESLEDFKRAASAGPDRIMLDNMSCADMARAVEYRNVRYGGIELEASGNITEERIGEVAAAGVDFISVGALTHSVKAFDIHLVLL
jgi:nicotinate-nucleotide pyrophosphorylase (carboxylating)